MRDFKIAPKGMIYTDGIAYGTKVSFGDGVNEDDWYLITEEEYERILNENHEEE